MGVIRTELLGVADAVAREKGIDREIVIEAVELALQKASRARYGLERDIRTHIDRKTGEVVMKSYQEVVRDVENEYTQIQLKAAQTLNAHIKEGEFIIKDLPPFDYGRVAAQIGKQVISQCVRDAERLRQYNEYKDRVGEVINGVVKRIEFGNIMVDIGRAEAILMRNQLIARESFRVGDRIRAYIEDVRNEPRGSQIFLSRTNPYFMAKLFTQEVPEIYDNHIVIKAVARDPGSRAKMAVYSSDRTMDPVGACVGMRGSRVQAVTTELQGEKIDIIPWSENPLAFVVNAMVPAEVSKVILDEESGRIEVSVPDDQLRLAIGRRGQNVRLASDLTGFAIEVISETQALERRNQEVKTVSTLFMQALDIEEVIAHLLISENFKKVEEIALADLEEIMNIEGFDEDLAREIQDRAQSYILLKQLNSEKELVQIKVTAELIAFMNKNYDYLKTLAENNIKSLKDLADLSNDELRDILPKLGIDEANDLIMHARDKINTNEK